MADNKTDLCVEIGSLKLRNPIMVASGTFGYGPEYAGLLDLNQLGALVVKGICMEPKRGNPPPRTVEVPGGLINAIGLPGPGVQGFIDTYIPFLQKYTVPVIVNIWGVTVEEFAGVAAALQAVDTVAGLEINVSCPNIKEGSKSFGSNPDMFEAVVKAVRAVTDKPVIPKLAPLVTDVTEYARIAEGAGADAVSLINSIPAMAIDIESRKPILGNKIGGLSGPAIHPIAVKMVYDTAQAVQIPIIAMGGITGPETAVEFLLAGASAVSVGTANFTDPSTALRVIAGLERYMDRHGYACAADLTGDLRS